jgi:hypothetical protein
MKKYGGIAQSNSEKDDVVYQNNGNAVLQHDICGDIPKIFFGADVVFSVMAWRAGYKHFIENTIAKESTFIEYCEGMRRTIEELNKPSFVISNKTFVKNLGSQRIEPIRFDRFNSDDVCAIWNYKGDIPSTTTELMRFIGDRYDTVLDFCCGYGEIAHYSKHFILSDINTGCLDYVKEEYLYGKTKN